MNFNEHIMLYTFVFLIMRKRKIFILKGIIFLIETTLIRYVIIITLINTASKINNQKYDANKIC